MKSVNNQRGIAHIFILLLLAVGILVGIYLVGNPQIFSPKAAETGTSESQKIAFHRLYKSQSNNWTWAGNQAELNNWINQGYQDNGTLFSAFVDGNTPETVPLYVLYKLVADDGSRYNTYITTNKGEADKLLQASPWTRDYDPRDNTANGGNGENLTGDSWGSNDTARHFSWQLRDQSTFVYPAENPPSGSVPIYRLVYQSQDPSDYYLTGSYYYSTDYKEIAALMSTGKYINQGIAFYSADTRQDYTQNNPTSESVPVYRLHNTQQGYMVWSGNKQEVDALVNQGFVNQGVIFYAYVNIPPGVKASALYTLEQNSNPIHYYLTTKKDELALLLRPTEYKGERDDRLERAYKNGLTNNWFVKDRSLFVIPNTETPPAGSVPVFQISAESENAYYRGPAKYYTSDPKDVETLVATGKYKNDGIAFYGAPPPVTATQAPTEAPIVTSKPDFGEKTLAYCNGSISRVHLEWAQVPGVKIYQLWRVPAGTTDHQKVTEQEHYAFNDETVTPGIEYVYTAQAIIGEQNIYGQSKSIKAVSCP